MNGVTLKMSTDMAGLKKNISQNIEKIFVVLSICLVLAIFFVFYQSYQLQKTYADIINIKSEYKSYLNTLKTIIDSNIDTSSDAGLEDELDEAEKKSLNG
jgi:hypothetical protein